MRPYQKRIQQEISQEDHGGKLAWPGLDGIPFRGDIPDLKQGEEDNLAIVPEFRSRMFELWNAEHKVEFDKVYSRVHRGWYAIQNRIDKWDDQNGHLRVWLEWVQVYKEHDAEKRNG